MAAIVTRDAAGLDCPTRHVPAAPRASSPRRLAHRHLSPPCLLDDASGYRTSIRKQSHASTRVPADTCCFVSVGRDRMGQHLEFAFLVSVTRSSKGRCTSSEPYIW